MNFSFQSRALTQDLIKAIEDRRRKQLLPFRDVLLKTAKTDIEIFCTQAIYVLPPHLWTLVEDLERTEEKIKTTKSVRLLGQFNYFKKAVIKSLISAMLFREKGESYNGRLLEIISLASE